MGAISEFRRGSVVEIGLHHEVLLHGLIGLALTQLAMATVPLAEPADLGRLAALGFAVVAVEEDAGRDHALVVVSPITRQWLVQAGFATAIAPAPLVGPTAVFENYADFDDPVRGIRRQLEDLASARANVHLDSIGASVEGRPILVVKVGARDDAPERPNVVFLGTHHAREWVSTTMAMYLLRYVADSADAALVGARDIWIVPVVNPDGYQYSFAGDRLWRKNRRLNRDGSHGVDLNRNYPGFWALDDQGSSPRPESEVYRGTAPASEPETQAIVRFHAAHPPVVGVSYHTYLGLILHPFGFEFGRFAADEGVFAALAGTPLRPAVIDRLSSSSRRSYLPAPGWKLYSVNGEYTDWTYEQYRTIAFTPELTSGCCVDGRPYGFMFPDDAALLQQVHADNLPFAIAAIQAADDVTRARGPSGLMPPPPRVQSLWPEIRILSRRPGAPATRRVTVRSTQGTVAELEVGFDSLETGAVYRRYRARVGSQPVAALTVQGSAVKAELIHHAGAAAADAAWSGWAATDDALVGDSAWIGVDDTLVSPDLATSGRSKLWLQVWTKHLGSAFLPNRRGIAQFSVDGGATWTDLELFAGFAPEWYPARLDLPAAVRGRVRFRFISHGMTWLLDAIGLVSDESALFEAVGPVAVDDLEVSDNPVRRESVSFAWPATASVSRITVYTFSGAVVFEAPVTPGSTRLDWGLVTTSGARVGDGAYIVVARGANVLLRRRVFVARGT